MRIVSLLPSTTEILFAIGAGDDVVGVTFECDYPVEAPTRRIVSTSAMPEGLTPVEIDAFVVNAMARGEDLYHLDKGALAWLDADLVVTQDLCAVCAVDVSVVDDALDYLGCTAEVLTIDPHTLDDVLESFVTLGRATGHLEEAERLVTGQRRRLDVVRRRTERRLTAPRKTAPRKAGARKTGARKAARAQTARRPRPRVMFLEWTEPPFAPGHWIPEMISIAGGDAVLGTPGEKSRRVSWKDVQDTAPDVVVVGPCGFDRSGSQRLAEELVASGNLPSGVPVHAVDANASWARPGTRLPDGVEELAGLLAGLPAASSA
ncbi:MAG: cobalamin-binding protein [Nocardioides sp.]|nr:cobalamin-binding protein [Nocardioides sp.]